MFYRIHSTDCVVTEKSLRLVCISLIVLLNACATIPQDHQYKPHEKTSYVVRGHNSSLAIYNGEHRLITHPVEDLFAEIKWRKLANQPDITDIYVVSHGWNYTLPVAIANYHSYMERVDNLMAKKDLCASSNAPLGDSTEEKTKLPPPPSPPPANRCFQPYFIFVTWTSTTRPTTDLVNAIVPFGLDAAVMPLTSFIDKIPMHILTAWKQSLSATQNALGAKYPNDYLNLPWEATPYGYIDSNIIEDSDSSMGEDLPVSALLYKLVRQKSEKPSNTAPGECTLPDIFDPKSDGCVNLINTKIHLVGHSYGAKLMAQAGMEAMRRWMLDGIAKEWKDSKGENYAEACNMPSGVNSDGLSSKQCVSSATGHRGIGSEVIETVFNQGDKPTALKKWYENHWQMFPIDSLVLFNPAFHPSELSYPVESMTSAPVDTLRFIPRKAIVYSNTDYANGGLFGLRELLLNTTVNQWFQPFGNIYEQIYQNQNGLAKAFTFPLIKTGEAINGALSLGYGVAYSQIGFAFHALINIPADFWHHVKFGELDGFFKPESDPSLNIGTVVNGVVNGVDFFLPLKLSRPLDRLFNLETSSWDDYLPLFFLRDEAQQGLFRLSRSGLGKTGLNHLAEGRSANTNLWGVSAYYTAKEPFGEPKCIGDCQGYAEVYADFSRAKADSNGRLFVQNVDADQFVTMEHVLGIRKDFSQGELLWQREKFYSFDASKVYDSWVMPFVGSHSDLRETEYPNITDICVNQKRDYTLNFLLNFTKTNFEQTLLKEN